MSLLKTGKASPKKQEQDNQTEYGIPGSDQSSLFYITDDAIPTVSHGEGIYMWDTKGKKYLDACSGPIAVNLGHGHKRIIDAAKEQMDKISFAYRTQFESEISNKLADLLVRLSPEGLDRVFFVNSGSEAVEAAMKLARQYWWVSGKQGKRKIISRTPAYHGATLGALTLTSYAPLNIPFSAMQVSSPKVAAPYCYHCPLGKNYPECKMSCARQLEEVIRLEGADNIAAFIAEPIGGASTGGAVPPDEWFPMVEQICHENDILLIVDDVMMGCGRTGTFYGYEHWDVTPDIVAVSKGLSAGYSPIGACIAGENIIQPVMESGGFMHGHTYAGNPLSAAVSYEVICTILEENILENTKEMGAMLHERLHEMKERFPAIGDVRGRGLLAGVEFVQNRDTRDPFPANWMVAQEATAIARDKYGLLIYPRRSLNGLKGDHVLIAPALNIDRAGMEDLLDRFEKTMLDLTDLLEKYIVEDSSEPDSDYGTHSRYKIKKTAEYDFDVDNLDELKTNPDTNVTRSMYQEEMMLDTPEASEDD